MTAPVLDLSPEARTARYHADLRALRRARRAAWRASGGNRREFRRLMATWIATRRAPAPGDGNAVAYPRMWIALNPEPPGDQQSDGPSSIPATA